jgi:hypothetical protein
MTDLTCVICKRNDFMCCEVTKYKNKIVCDMCFNSMKKLTDKQ